jgi:hypothetical protein
VISVTLSEWLGVIGLVIGVLSFAYAVWENRSRARLQNYIRAQNWLLYGKASTANGHTQRALHTYMTVSKDALNPEVLGLLYAADAYGQDVLKDAVRQIQFSEPRFDADSIARWTREGRVPENHSPLFHLLTPADKPIYAAPKSDAGEGGTRTGNPSRN